MTRLETPTLPSPLPTPELAPQSNPACRCAPKKRKPREPRTVCYRGTYRETSSSTHKSPREEVPCEGGAKGGKVAGTVASLVGGSGGPLTRGTGQLGTLARTKGLELLRQFARRQLGEKLVPLTKRERRARAVERRRFAAEMRAKREQLRKLKAQGQVLELKRKLREAKQARRA